MGKRKVFERQILDVNTGELHSEEVHYRYDNTETYGMHRTTSGLGWIKDFSGNEMKMLMLLLELEDIKSGVVSYSRLSREHLISFFGKSERHIASIIAALEAKKALVRLTQTDIVINPLFFYKGGTKNFKKRYSFYLSAIGETNIEEAGKGFDNE